MVAAYAEASSLDDFARALERVAGLRAERAGPESEPDELRAGTPSEDGWALGARNIHWEATLPIGVTRLHREFVRRDPMGKGEANRVRERLLEALARLAPATCIAAGGTARAFARIAVARRGLRPRDANGPVEIRVEELAKMTRRMVRADHADRLAIAGVRRNRADLMPTGGIVLTTLAEALGIESYTVCDWGLREGVVLEALAEGVQ